MFGVCSSLSLSFSFFFFHFQLLNCRDSDAFNPVAAMHVNYMYDFARITIFFSFSSSLLYRFLRGNSIKPNCSRFCAIHVYIYNTLSGFFIFYIFFLLAFGASFAVALQTPTASNSVWCLCIRIMKYAKVLAHCFAGILLHLKNLSWL